MATFGAITSPSSSNSVRRYPYTLIGDLRSPEAPGRETGKLNQLSNVMAVSITEIAIQFEDNPIARPLYLRFSSNDTNITPNDLNGQRNQTFYFTPEVVSNTLRWQAANEENGLLQTTDQNLLKLDTILVVVHDADTDTPLAYRRCVIRFMFKTLGSRFGAQAQLQQVLDPSRVVGIWAV
jgi:hypothetical protein